MARWSRLESSVSTPQNSLLKPGWEETVLRLSARALAAGLELSVTLELGASLTLTISTTPIISICGDLVG